MTTRRRNVCVLAVVHNIIICFIFRVDRRHDYFALWNKVRKNQNNKYKINDNNDKLYNKM